MDTIISLHYYNRNIPACTCTWAIRLTGDYQVLDITVLDPYDLPHSRPKAGVSCRAVCSFFNHIATWRLAGKRRRQQQELIRQFWQQLQTRQSADPFLDPTSQILCFEPEHVPQNVLQNHWTGEFFPEGERIMGMDFTYAADGSAVAFKWLARLFDKAQGPHFVVLGTTGCMYRILAALSPRMKTLRWILPDYTYTEQAQKLAQAFYEDYGLAIDLRFLTDKATYARLRMTEEMFYGPVDVLDFTEGRYLPDLRLPEGSNWFDAGASGEKQRRIATRGIKAHYHSLRVE